MTIENYQFKCDQCWRTTDVTNDVSQWDIGVKDTCPECLRFRWNRWMSLAALVVLVAAVWGMLGFVGWMR